MSRLARALMVCLFLMWPASAVQAATASWNTNPEPDIAGYILSYGTVSGTYTTSLNVGNVTSVLIPLSPGVQYFFVVQAYNTGGQTSPYSTQVAFTVDPGAPTFTTQPTSQTVTAGLNTSFTVAASGTPTPAYQWQISTNSGLSWTNLANAVPYSGVTTATLTLTSVTTALTGAWYRAVATSSAGNTPSNAATLAVNLGIAPAITTQPSGQTVTAGQNASFAVAASGTPAPTYQWQVSTNGGTSWTNLTNVAPYSGVTTATLTLTSITSGLTGNQYRAVAANGAGSATSNAATLTVSVAPAITTQPTSQTVAAGSNASFTVAANGTPTPTYQWQVSTDSGASWTNLTNAAPYSGVTTATLALTSVTSGLTGNQYRAVATNSVGSATSTAAMLTVNAVPTIATQPTSQTVVVGANVSFTVAASGTPTPTYQWQVSTNGGSTWTNLTNTAPYSGVATTTLTVTSVTASLTGSQYRAVATNSVGSATSTAATLTVNTAPTVTTQPISQTVVAGSNASFSVAASGTPTPTYQWQVSTDSGASWANLTNSAPYSGVTTATLAVTGATTSLSGVQYQAVASNSVGSVTSNAATLTVTTGPAITTQPSSQSVTAGTTVSFMVAASGTPTPTYQWQVSTNGGTSWTNLTNTAPYSGVATTTLTVTSVTASLTGSQYRAVATNSVGSATSTAATLTVNTAPTVTTQPISQTVVAGSNASFSVAASGAPAPTYQWQISTDSGASWNSLTNTAPYSGVTTATLALTNTTASLSGLQYRAVATNSVGSATSTAATLTVNTAPTVTTQPISQTVVAGSNASFSVAASGAPTPTYQWQVSSDSGTSWTNLSNAAPYSGVTTTTLTLSGVTAALSGNLYRAVATNVVSSVTSSAATLTVNVPPAITSQPANQTVATGSTAAFTTAATGTPAPSFQWQVSTDGGASFSNLLNGAPYSGATTSTLTVTNVTSGLVGNQYRAVATNSVGSATSTAATLTLNDLAPVFTAQPTNQTVTAGQNASFIVAASGTPAPTFQWQVSTNSGASWTNLANAAPYNGVTTTTLSVTGATVGIGGSQYRAIATNSAGTATSSAATLTVNAAPSITTQPTSQVVIAGSNTSFTAAASGTPTPTYQWQLSTNSGSTWTNLTNVAPYGGVTTTTLTVTGVTAGLTGAQYRAVASNSVGSATSSAGTLTVNVPPAITTQPIGQTVTAGQNGSFTVAASGTPSPTYQWQVSTDSGASWANLTNAAPYSGVTTAILSVTSATTGLSGAQYRAVASNSAGSAVSNAATLTVNSAPASPVITTQPLSQTVTAGTVASFIVAASGTPAPTYQWQVSTDSGASWANLTNTAPYSGVSTATLAITSVTSGLAGNQYRAVATNSAGAATSNAATLNVSTSPIITAQPVGQTVTAGQNASFTVAASGAPTPTYQWQVSTDSGVSWTNLTNTSPYSGVTTVTLTLTSVTTGLTGAQYRAVATNSGGSATSNAATLIVNVAAVPPAITVQPASQSVIAGANVSFSTAASGIPAPAYQWQLSTNGGASWSNLTNVAPYSGTTTVTLTLTGVTTGMGGSQYRAFATNSAGTATSTAAILAVNTAPVVTTQPASQTVGAGQNASFTVAASGTPTPTYQWQVSIDGGASWANLANAAPHSGVTTITLTVSNVSATFNGWRYRAVATNVAGSATSSAATLTVDVTVPPTITTQPADETVVAGQDASFTAAATGTPAPSYQWQVSTDSGTTWANLNNTAPYSGVTTPTLTLTAVTMSLNGRRHRSIVTNSAGATTSNPATLTVAAAPTITTQPASPTVSSGQAVSFTVAASGTPTLTYQWQMANEAGVSWVNVLTASATTPTLTLTSVTTWLNRAQFRCVVTNAAGSTTSSAATLKVHGKLSVSAAWLSFTATKAGATGALGTVVPGQSTLSVSFTGAGSSWTATSNQPWLQITNGSGTNDGSFTAQVVNPGNVIGGSTSLNATIVVTTGNANDWPVLIPVTLTVVQTQSLTADLSAAPTGSFDAPGSGTTGLQGAVALSGWALASGSDVGIDRVEIWRDSRPGETTPTYAGVGPGHGKIFVAAAPLIGGARPDVEAMFAGNKQATHAGWGALVVTPGLSSQGDGTYTLYAVAYDTAGVSAILGTTTITVDNTHATQPFGDLDVPTDGAIVSGTIPVAGWALTPGASCAIARGGMWMSVDAGPLVPVSDGQLRSDIAAAFSGFTNSDQAGGAATLDTTTLAEGMHQISWSVADTCGRQAWIGSRFVTVRNARADAAPMDNTSQIATLASLAADNSDPIVVQTHNETGRLAYPNAAGVRIVRVDQGDRVDVQLPVIGSATYAGFEAVNGTARALPLGSALDATRGRFAWEPAAGFLGSYELVFVATTNDGGSQAVRVRVIVGPSVRLQIDQPSAGVEAVQPFELTGWAIDLAAADGTGIDAVEVWATPTDGGTPIRLGAAVTNERRADVAMIYSDQFQAAGFRFLVDRLPAGTYDVRISITTAGTGTLGSTQGVRITVR